MAVKVTPGSRLQLVDLLVYSRVEFWDTLILDPVPEADTDSGYTVVGGDRIDLLAHRFYGDATLWWFIAVANDLELLPVDLDYGDVLRIPSKDSYTAYVAAAKLVK